jgi:hypothetical protein
VRCRAVLTRVLCCGEVEFERLGELVGLAAATSSGGNVHVHFTETTTVPHHMIIDAGALGRVWRSYMYFRPKSRMCENALLFLCSNNNNNNKERENAARIRASIRGLRFPSSAKQDYMARRRLYKRLWTLDVVHSKERVC